MKHYKEILRLIEIRHDASRTKKERQEAEAMWWWVLWVSVKRGTK
jgi:hypothetical protein